MKKKQKIILIVVAFLFTAFALSFVFLARFTTQRSTEMRGQAGIQSKEVTVFLFPINVRQLENTEFSVFPKVTLPSEKGLSLLVLSLTFDNSHINLVEIKNDSSVSNLQILKNTSVEDANREGRVTVVTGAIDIQSAPTNASGTFQLKFKIVSNKQSAISVNPSESQAVFTNEEVGVIKLDVPVQVDSQSVGGVSPTVISTPTVSTKVVSPTRSLVPSPSTTPITLPVSTGSTQLAPTFVPE